MQLKGLVKLENTIKISVRNMIEFISRKGDIDTTYRSMSRGKDGIRLHKKVQSKRKKQALLEGGFYESEYTLKHVFSFKDCTFLLEGRADGIIRREDYIAVEEIKSTSADLEEIEEDLNHWHLTQAKCYGYMYSTLHELDKINIILTYIHTETEEVKGFEYEFTKNELEVFFFQLVEKYYKFAEMDLKRISVRNETAKELGFPFENYRKGQRELSVSVYASIKNNKNLFVKAPTGIGKTASTIFPCVKALEQKETSKIFYLTSRNTNSLAAENCLCLLEKKGLKMRSVILTAKEKICPLEQCTCNPRDCTYARGHFDRVNDAIYDVISEETVISKEIIEKYAFRHTVCPFEFQLDITLFADVIVGDYNYAYDPSAKLKRFFGEGIKNDFVFLVDEAHNLCDRGREMFSATLKYEDLNTIKRAVRSKKSKIVKAAERVLAYLQTVNETYAKTEELAILPDLNSELYYLLKSFMDETDKFLANNSETKGHETVLEIYFNILDFLRIIELDNEGYITLGMGDGKNFEIKLFCVDPSYSLKAINEGVKSVVFFSATLMPISFYADILGGREDDNKLILNSPFHKDNLKLLINNRISTKYKDREKTYGSIASIVSLCISVKKGNYMVFFPSYAYMERIYGLFTEAHPEIETAIQVQKEKASDFLDRFRENTEKTFVGFAVLGAGYSEGIDLTGNKLIGSVIVGVGLPQISAERNIIKDYYIEKNGKGYEYAYMYPGMNKILQAAGRVIRTENDRGMVMLIDSRYLSAEYIALFPYEWQDYSRNVKEEDIVKELNVFWHES